METSCLVATFIVLFHILGPRSDTLGQCPRLRSDNGSDNGLFFIGHRSELNVDIRNSNTSAKHVNFLF
jgi:hypothetical protein